MKSTPGTTLLIPKHRLPIGLLLRIQAGIGVSPAKSISGSHRSIPLVKATGSLSSATERPYYSGIHVAEQLLIERDKIVAL